MLLQTPRATEPSGELAMPATAGRRQVSIESFAAPVARIHLPRCTYYVSVAFVLTASVAAAATYIFGGVLWGVPVMNGSCRGTALVMVTIAAPIMAMAMRSAARGSTRAMIVWFGMALHLTYNSALLVLGEPMNRLFLLYEASLALGIAAAVSMVVAVDHRALARQFSSTVSLRPFAVYLWVVAALNTLAWLGRIIPAVLDDTVPELLDGTGLSTVPTYVGDLAFWLPLIALSAWWLWQHRPHGFLLAGGALAFWALEGLTIAVDQWFGHRADPASTVASNGAVVPFVLLSIIGVVVLWRYLRHVSQSARQAPRTAACEQE